MELMLLPSFHFIGYAMDPHIIKPENRVNQSRLTGTMNKMCNEAWHGISKFIPSD